MSNGRPVAIVINKVSGGCVCFKVLNKCIVSHKLCGFVAVCISSILISDSYNKTNRLTNFSNLFLE